MFALCTGLGGHKSKNWREDDDWIGAYVEVQNHVEQRLKSPGTADFPWTPSKHGSNVATQTYYIEAYVDSQNGFGATLRTNFAAIIRKVGEDDWQVDKLTLE